MTGKAPSLPVSTLTLGVVNSFQEEEAREADFSPTCGTSASIKGAFTLGPVLGSCVSMLLEAAVVTCPEEGFSPWEISKRPSELQ